MNWTIWWISEIICAILILGLWSLLFWVTFYNGPKHSEYNCSEDFSIIIPCAIGGIVWGIPPWITGFIDKPWPQVIFLILPALIIGPVIIFIFARISINFKELFPESYY